MRVALSVLGLVLVVGAAGALAAWGMQRVPGDTSEYRVEVVGPSGTLMDERVAVEDATVLRALQAAAEQRNVTLRVETYPGMGTYVRAIAGVEAEGASGWIYEVNRGGAWRNGDRSAELFALQKGDSVRWTWTDA